MASTSSDGPGHRRSRRDTPALPLRWHVEGNQPDALPYPDTLQTIGDHLRKKRLDLCLRQRDVATQLGVTVNTVTNWEKHHSST
jgi:predicted transcriptional regulator